MKINTISSIKTNVACKKVNKKTENADNISLNKDYDISKRKTLADFKELSTKDKLLYLALALIGTIIIFKGMLPKKAEMDEDFVTTQVKKSFNKIGKDTLDLTQHFIKR